MTVSNIKLMKILRKDIIDEERRNRENERSRSVSRECEP